jgi:hypothetical protein
MATQYGHFGHIFIEVLISESYGGLFCHIASNLIAFSMKIMHRFKFCAGGILASVFIMELHSGVYRHEYLYHVAIFYSTSITKSMKIMHQLICY